MKKLCVSYIAVLSFSLCFAQSTPSDRIDNLKQVIPPSPNVSALGKYGDWPVSLYTGLPSINLPLYTVQSGTVAMPISLSYHPAGIKVGEIASWVGLGWSLNAGGAISRTVRGWPDEDNVSGYFVERQLYTNQNDLCSTPVDAQQAKVHRVNVAKGTADAEQDVYSFNALGRSFKFIFKADGSIVPMPYSKVKITTNFGPSVTVPTNVWWTVVLEDGTKLYFGGSGFVESMTTPPFDLSFSNLTTSWMLKQIVSPEGNTIDFAYTSSTVVQDIQLVEKDQVKYLVNSVFSGGASTCSNYIGNEAIKQKAKRSNVIQLSLSTI